MARYLRVGTQTRNCKLMFPQGLQKRCVESGKGTACTLANMICATLILNIKAVQIVLGVHYNFITSIQSIY